MARAFLVISNISFELTIDNDIKDYLLKRSALHYNSIHKTKETIKIICSKQDNINFSCEKFINQQEPDMTKEYYYREIYDLGIFFYNRKEKIFKINYINTNRYPFNSLEVVVDTIFQFVYLIMLEFDIAPIHASVVAHNDKAIVIFGNSGAGKTTLQLSLLHSGLSFFADDVAFLDTENNIHSSGEYAIACSDSTIELIEHLYNVFLVDREEGIEFSNKRILRIDKQYKSNHLKLNPFLIIFPIKSGTKKEELEKISAKESLVKLINLTISKQLTISQKKIYLNRLKNLAEYSNSYNYNYMRKTNNTDNDLKNICKIIKSFCTDTKN
jgi:hypothetical protein